MQCSDNELEAPNENQAEVSYTSRQTDEIYVDAENWWLSRMIWP